MSTNDNLLLTYFLKALFPKIFVFISLSFFWLKQVMWTERRVFGDMEQNKKLLFAFLSKLIVKTYINMCLYGLLSSIPSHKKRTLARKMPRCGEDLSSMTYRTIICCPKSFPCLAERLWCLLKGRFLMEWLCKGTTNRSLSRHNV